MCPREEEAHGTPRPARGGPVRTFRVRRRQFAVGSDAVTDANGHDRVGLDQPLDGHPEDSRDGDVHRDRHHVGWLVEGGERNLGIRRHRHRHDGCGRQGHGCCAGPGVDLGDLRRRAGLADDSRGARLPGRLDRRLPGAVLPGFRRLPERGLVQVGPRGRRHQGLDDAHAVARHRERDVGARRDGRRRAGDDRGRRDAGAVGHRLDGFVCR